MSWLRKRPPKGAQGSPPAPPRTDESWEAFACPDCGAVLRDTALRVCPYCQSAFFEDTQHAWKRVWHTPDGGATWTVRERTCAGCGATVADAAATICTRCGAALEAIVLNRDPRPTTSISVKMPPVPASPDKVTARFQVLVRYLDNHWWPVPPSVPRTVAGLLPLLPDNCPRCAGRTFFVALAPPESWQVLCTGCRESPGTRTDAPPTFPAP